MVMFFDSGSSRSKPCKPEEDKIQRVFSRAPMNFPKNPNLLGKLFISEKRAPWYGDNSQDPGEILPLFKCLFFWWFWMFMIFLTPKNLRRSSTLTIILFQFFRYFETTTNVTKLFIPKSIVGGHLTIHLWVKASRELSIPKKVTIAEAPLTVDLKSWRF